MNCHFCHHPCYLSSYKHLYLVQRLVQVFIFPFLWECSRTGIWIEYIGTSGQCWEIIQSKAWVSLQRCDPTVLFITDAASYHRRSCHAALWLLPHLQLRRVLICLLSSHSRGRSVCVLFLSIWYTSSTHSISSYPLYTLVETMDQVTMVRVIRVLGECRIVPSASLISELILFSQNSLGSSRINFNDSLSSSTLPRRIVLFKVLKNNWTTISGSNSSWSWPRDCKWSSLIPCSPV